MHTLLFSLALIASSPHYDASPGGGGAVTFPLTATDYLDMDGNAVINADYIESADADPADSGVLRCGNAEICLAAEANTPGTDLTLTLNASDLFEFAAGLQLPNSTVIDSPATGQLRLGTGGAGVVLDFDDVADVLAVKDYAGTGIGDFAVSTGGKLHVEGASGNTYIWKSGSSLVLHVDGTNSLSLAPSLATHMASNIVFRAPSASVLAKTTHRRVDPTPTADDVISEEIYEAYDDTPTADVMHGRIRVIQEEPADGDHDASWDLQLANDGAVTSVLKADMSDSVEAVVFAFPHHYVGEMYQRDNASATTINTIDVWEEVDNFSSGKLYGFTHATGDLTATNTGTYICHAKASYFTSGTNQTTETVLSVDNVVQDKCIAKRLIGTGRTLATSAWFAYSI